MPTKCLQVRVSGSRYGSGIPPQRAFCGTAAGGSLSEQLLRRNVKSLRGGLVGKAHRLVYHSTLGPRVIKRKKEGGSANLSPREGATNNGAFFSSILIDAFSCLFQHNPSQLTPYPSNCRPILRQPPPYPVPTAALYLSPREGATNDGDNARLVTLSPYSFPWLSVEAFSHSCHSLIPGRSRRVTLSPRNKRMTGIRERLHHVSDRTVDPWSARLVTLSPCSFPWWRSFTSCIVKSFRSHRSFISNLLWTL